MARNPKFKVGDVITQEPNNSGLLFNLKILDVDMKNYKWIVVRSDNEDWTKVGYEGISSIICLEKERFKILNPINYNKIWEEINS